MADGKVSFTYSHFLGLDKDKETGKIVINPEQAETVRLIFHLFLEGMTPHSIAAELTSLGIKNACRQRCVEPTDGAPDALEREVQARHSFAEGVHSGLPAEKMKKTRARSRNTMWKATTR